ncbi:uncharacterized protein [Aristolochia californica]|uniref:uncharacterized protein n=1 Tax=Aristolochia californica TaxID=171875 RepID=UPI0035DB05FC
MEWSPKLQRQRSCSCAAVDLGYWSHSARRSGSSRRNYNACDEEFESLNYSLVRSNAPRWHVLWRKIMKEKRRIFHSSSQFQVPYDSYTYSQNFDQGSDYVEPDNLSRSFSARFADPSRVLRLQRVG